MDGKKVVTYDDLYSTLDEKKIGETVQVTYVRDRKTRIGRASSWSTCQDLRVRADMDKEQRQYKDAVQALTSLEGGGFQARLGRRLRQGPAARARRRPTTTSPPTPGRPDAVIRHFAATGRRTVPTGIDHRQR